MWNHLVDRFGRFGWAQTQNRHSCELCMEESECRCSIPLYCRRSGVTGSASLENLARRNSLSSRKNHSLWRLSSAKSQENIGRFHQRREDSCCGGKHGAGGTVPHGRMVYLDSRSANFTPVNIGKAVVNTPAVSIKANTIPASYKSRNVNSPSGSKRGNSSPLFGARENTDSISDSSQRKANTLVGTQEGNAINLGRSQRDIASIPIAPEQINATSTVTSQGGNVGTSVDLTQGALTPVAAQKGEINTPWSSKQGDVQKGNVHTPVQYQIRSFSAVDTQRGETRMPFDTGISKHKLGSPVQFKEENIAFVNSQRSNANTSVYYQRGDLPAVESPPPHPPPPVPSYSPPPPPPPRRWATSFKDFQRGNISPVLPPRRNIAPENFEKGNNLKVQKGDFNHESQQGNASQEPGWREYREEPEKFQKNISNFDFNKTDRSEESVVKLSTPKGYISPGNISREIVSPVEFNRGDSLKSSYKETTHLADEQSKVDESKELNLKSEEQCRCLGKPLSPDSQQKQLQAYVAWVNSQLKKKPGTRTVEDLHDMQDGVALADLIEIVANEQLQGIYGAPSSAIEMISNVDKVLQFMTSHRIRMHHTTAPDIVEGNLKSIMRLILALAAHYKPKSVKHSSQQPQAGALSPRSHPTLIGLAQGAAAAIADARRDASIVHQRPQRPRYLAQDNRFQGSGSESEAGAADPERGEQLQVLRYRERGELEGASCGSSPRSSVPGSPKANRRLNFGAPKSPPQDLDSGHHRDEEVHDVCDGEAEVWHELSEEHNGLVQDMEVTKRALLQLQKLLLSGQPPDGQEDPEGKPCEGATADEQLVVLKSQLQQTEELCRDLREELSKVKNDAMQLQGTKAGLQKRLAEQDEAFLKMKAELLRVGFAQQSLQTEKGDLERKVLEQDRLIHDLRRELQHRDRQIEELVASLQFQQQDKDMTTRALHTQIVDLHEKLQMVGETEVSLSQRVASQDRKMALLEGKLLHTQFESPSRPSSARSHQSGNSDDLQVMRDSLQSLRTNFAGNDPTHHTIDTLERSISGLMERLQMSEASRLSDSLNMSSRHHYNYDSTGDLRRSPISTVHMQGINRLDSSSSSNNSNSGTKVLYFTDRAVTPFMCSIQKRLGEICLRDFKEMYDRHGNYRYHFKAMDPEFGTVKEEITNDDDIIPGWEGKIVAWIEEDHG